MNLPSLRNRTAAIALSLGCALALLRCDTQVAGSSVTTGNPTEIQVSFTGDGKPTALTGRVELYGATQIPVPGFQPEPLASFEVEDAEDFTLKASDLEAIPDSLWPVGSVLGDSLVRFNLSILSADAGALVRELILNKKSLRFQVPDSGTVAENGRVIKLPATLLGLVPFKVTVKIESLMAEKEHFLFLRGTGYYARSDSGLFSFDFLPKGRFEPNVISIWKKDEAPVGTIDSVAIRSVTATLDTDAEQTVDLGNVVDVVPLPQSLRP